MKINKFNSQDKILQYPNKLDYFFNRHKTLIVTELDLTNKCNHRCPGCCGNNENNAELSKDQIDNIAKSLKNIGNQGVILSGGGEPTVSPYFEYAINLLKKSNQNLGLNSHGMNLDERKCEIIAENMEYFRISLDAGSPEMYQKIHGMKPHHFAKTLENIALFSSTRNRLNSKTSFGVGFLTSKDTIKDAREFVKLVKQRGADFAQFRPFTGDTTDILPLLTELRAEFEDDNFKITASMQKYKEMESLKEESAGNTAPPPLHNLRGYNKCHGMFFSTCISADYRVWACLHYRQDESKLLGDLREESLEEIFRGSKIIEVYNSIDCSKCPILCRNDSFNRTLETLSLDITNKEFL